jgi:hypothetical protein
MRADLPDSLIVTGTSVDEWRDPDTPAKKWAYDTPNAAVKASLIQNEVGGLPVVRFPGTARSRYLGPSMTDGSAGAMMFIIMKHVGHPTPDGQNGAWRFSTFGSQTRWGSGGDFFPNFGNDRMWTGAGGFAAFGSFHSLIMVNTNALGCNTYLNNATIVDQGGIPNSWPGTPVLGEETSTNFLKADILEMWFFTGATFFDAQQRSDLEQYKTDRISGEWLAQETPASEARNLNYLRRYRRMALGKL